VIDCDIIKESRVIERKGFKMQYEVRQPISSDYNLDREARTATKHRTIEGARKALEKHWKGCIRQGGYSQNFIWDAKAEQRVPDYEF